MNLAVYTSTYQGTTTLLVRSTITGPSLNLLTYLIPVNWLLHIQSCLRFSSSPALFDFSLVNRM